MAAGSACSRGARPWLPCARETREEGAMGGPMLLRTYRKKTEGRDVGKKERAAGFLLLEVQEKGAARGGMRAPLA